MQNYLSPRFSWKTC